MEAAAAQLESGSKHSIQFLPEQNTRQRTLDCVSKHSASSGSMQLPRDNHEHNVSIPQAQPPNLSVDKGI